MSMPSRNMLSGNMPSENMPLDSKDSFKTGPLWGVYIPDEELGPFSPLRVVWNNEQVTLESLMEKFLQETKTVKYLVDKAFSFPMHYTHNETSKVLTSEEISILSKIGDMCDVPRFCLLTSDPYSGLCTLLQAKYHNIPESLMTFDHLLKAVSECNMDVILYHIPLMGKLNHEKVNTLFVVAAENGKRPETIKMLDILEQYTPDSLLGDCKLRNLQMILNVGIFNSNFDILEWCMKKPDSKVFTQQHCTHAAKAGNLKLLKWLKDHGAPWNGPGYSSIYKGVYNIEVLDWIYSHPDAPPVTEYSFYHAIQYGDIEILEWHYSRKSECKARMRMTDKIKEKALEEAAYSGRLDVFEWVASFTQDIDWRHMIAAANRGMNAFYDSPLHRDSTLKYSDLLHDYNKGQRICWRTKANKVMPIVGGHGEINKLAEHEFLEEMMRV